MANENLVVTLGSLATFINGDRSKNYPSQSDRVPLGIPFVNAADLAGGSVCFNSAEKITKAAFDRLSSGKTDIGDILFCLRGTPGRVARNTSGIAAIASSLVILRPNPEVDERFFFYLLSSPALQSECAALNNGSAQPNVSAGALRGLLVEIPRLEEQRAIAHILGTLDDKIELNRKQNETLEAMARTLFKAWFVDFEPVRAKMEGRWQRGQSRPGLPAHLYDIFPDRLVESALGEIPEGWEVRSFSDAVQVVGGGTPKTSIDEYWGGDIPWFSVVDTPAASDVFVVQTEKSITQAGLNGSSARMVAKGTTIISARGTVGNLAIAGRDMTFNQSCYALRGKNGSGDYFVFLSAQRMVEQLKAMAHGSVFSTITRQTFDAVRVVLPPEHVRQKFEQSTVGLFDALLSSVNESRSLAQLRDTLLPKLISGELRVGNADKYLRGIA